MAVYWSIHTLPELSAWTRDERRALFQPRGQFMHDAKAAAAPAAFLGTDLLLLVLSEWMKHRVARVVCRPDAGGGVAAGVLPRTRD